EVGLVVVVDEPIEEQADREVAVLVVRDVRVEGAQRGGGREDEGAAALGAGRARATVAGTLRRFGEVRRRVADRSDEEPERDEGREPEAAALTLWDRRHRGAPPQRG